MSASNVKQDESGVYQPSSLVKAAGTLTVYDLFAEAAGRTPHARSLVNTSLSYSYKQTLNRVDAIAAGLQARGLKQGDRIAVLSENCTEYIELHLAAACIGAVVACQNWRLTNDEIEQCLNLVSPTLLLYSERFEDKASALSNDCGVESEALCLVIRDWVETPQELTSRPVSDIESPMLILYTSGTTGPAKAAVISQRALLARMLLLRTDLGITPQDAFVAWAPMFHMGGSEHSLSTLMMGGTVFVADGFDVDYIAQLIGSEYLGWLLLVPATIDRLLERLDQQKIEPLGVKTVGAMADLLPKKQLAAISGRLRAPFLNTFGSTETGIAPASGHMIPPGEEPATLSKRLNSYCAFRLVDESGSNVAMGEVGEAAVKGPTLFSGYWNNETVNAKDFTGGWFRMGDLFTQNADGSLDFFGRSKYLIKSGGENIYPAEIEAVLLADHRVLDAAVISSKDEKWGEVPVAAVAFETGASADVLDALMTICRDQLASYKVPKAILPIPFDRLVRNTSGKIDRNDLERQLKQEGLIN